ncbi:MAG: DUF6624 domain-containing protein [Planctomycetota bacterium]
MTTRNRSAATLSVSALLLAAMLTGCAGSPGSFAQASGDAFGTPSSAERVLEARDPNAVELFGDDVVVGTLYDDRGVPRFQASVESLTAEEIAEELREMKSLDEQLVRESTDYHTPTPAELARVDEIDRAHAQRLAEIVEVHGWPARESFGADAAQGAFVVIQHAGHDPEFQSFCLSLMVDQVEQGTLPAAYVALLTDRIRLFADQPQVFGTQMTFIESEDGFFRCQPATAIEDPANLDARRELMGLPPHDLFVAKLEEAFQAQGGGSFASVITD